MNLTKSLIRVFLVTVALLLIPLTAMQFTAEVNWSPLDFIGMGMLLFMTGLALEFIASRRGPVRYRLAATITVVAALMQIWANLAVGFIGSGPNPANLLCGFIPVAGLAGAIVVRFRPVGLAYTLATMALVQLLVPVLANAAWHLAVKQPEWIASGLFAAVWLVAAALFHSSAAARQHAG